MGPDLAHRSGAGANAERLKAPRWLSGCGVGREPVGRWSSYLPAKSAGRIPNGEATIASATPAYAPPISARPSALAVIRAAVATFVVRGTVPMAARPLLSAASGSMRKPALSRRSDDDRVGCAVR